MRKLNYFRDLEFLKKFFTLKTKFFNLIYFSILCMCFKEFLNFNSKYIQSF